jgi:hypothetical protein
MKLDVGGKEACGCGLLVFCLGLTGIAPWQGKLMSSLWVCGALGRVKGTKLLSKIAPGIWLATEFTGKEVDRIALSSGITKVKLQLDVGGKSAWSKPTLVLD